VKIIIMDEQLEAIRRLASSEHPSFHLVVPNLFRVSRVYLTSFEVEEEQERERKASKAISKLAKKSEKPLQKVLKSKPKPLAAEEDPRPIVQALKAVKKAPQKNAPDMIGEAPVVVPMTQPRRVDSAQPPQPMPPAKEPQSSSACFMCSWKFPPEYIPEQMNRHINLCLDGKGQADIEQYRLDTRTSKQIDRRTEESEEEDRPERCHICSCSFKKASDEFIMRHTQECEENPYGKKTDDFVIPKKRPSRRDFRKSLKKLKDNDEQPAAEPAHLLFPDLVLPDSS
jgi:hypothetical protein